MPENEQDEQRTTERNWEQITIRIDKDLARRFAVAVVEDREKMTPLIRDFIRSYVDNHEAKKSGQVPLDSLDLSDLSTEQKEFLRVALIAIRQPTLNFGTRSLMELIKLNFDHYENLLSPSPAASING
jgi:hypothetical protein